MRAALVHGPDAQIRPLRQALLGAGLDCAAEDCVVWDQLSVRLAEGDVDLIVIKADDDGVDWDALEQASALTSAAKLAIGAADNGVASRAREYGVSEWVDAGNLRLGLDAALQRMIQGGVVRSHRGRVVSVFAPTAGSGGTTVATNLASALAKSKIGSVALLELSHESGDLALLLNLTPEHTVEDVYQRWESLDTTSLKNSVATHASGISVLPAAVERQPQNGLHLESARRIAVLARTAFAHSILALDSRLGEEELEVMRLSDSVVFVVRPDVPAVRRAQRALNIAIDAGITKQRFQLVVNRWGQGGQLKLSQIESSLGLQPVQLIADDAARLNQAANEGHLLLELAGRAKITRQFAALAATISGRPLRQRKMASTGVSRQRLTFSRLAKRS